MLSASSEIHFMGGCMVVARLLSVIIFGAASLSATAAGSATDAEVRQLLEATPPPKDVAGVLRAFHALAQAGIYERDDSEQVMQRFFGSVPGIEFQARSLSGTPDRMDLSFWGAMPRLSFEDVVKALGSGWKRNGHAEMARLMAHVRELDNPPLPPTTHLMGRAIITYPAGPRPIVLEFDEAGLLDRAGIQFGPDTSDETVIPIELIKDNAVAAAKINGVPVTLGIDSGGGAVVLKPEIIERVHATRVGATKQSTDAYGKTTPQAMFNLSSLELGGTTFPNVAAGEASAYFAQAPGDGVVGREFLNQFVVIYDYEAQRITLFPPSERRAADYQCRGTIVPTLPDPEGVIVTLAQTDQQMMRMLWDTGATHSFVKKTFADEHRLPVENPFYTSQRFKLGPVNFGPLQFVVADFNAPPTVDGYVGHDFFATHVVCIDPFNKFVRVRGY